MKAFAIVLRSMIISFAFISCLHSGGDHSEGVLLLFVQAAGNAQKRPRFCTFFINLYVERMTRKSGNGATTAYCHRLIRAFPLRTPRRQSLYGKNSPDAALYDLGRPPAPTFNCQSQRWQTAKRRITARFRRGLRGWDGQTSLRNCRSLIRRREYR